MSDGPQHYRIKIKARDIRTEPHQRSATAIYFLRFNLRFPSIEANTITPIIIIKIAKSKNIGKEVSSQQNNRNIQQEKPANPLNK